MDAWVRKPICRVNTFTSIGFQLIPFKSVRFHYNPLDLKVCQVCKDALGRKQRVNEAIIFTSSHATPPCQSSCALVHKLRAPHHTNDTANHTTNNCTTSNHIGPHQRNCTKLEQTVHTPPPLHCYKLPCAIYQYHTTNDSTTADHTTIDVTTLQ